MNIYEQLFRFVDEEIAYAMFAGIVLGIIDRTTEETPEQKLSAISEMAQVFKTKYPEAISGIGKQV